MEVETDYRPGKILLGKYRIDSVLGAGGMGFVLAATHLRMGGSVALKMLLPELALDPTFVERFVREAHAAARIKSEHVARVLDVETLDDGLPLIVMELLEGHDLGEEVQLKGPVPLQVAADYVLQACEALAEAHSKGIVHRDLKPANLFLTQRADGSRLVKVMDFGIAKALAESESDSLTATQDVVGSPLYMSPEQLRSSKDVDARTDIWSLGVILYELVSADLPFVGPSSAAVLAAVAADRPRPIQELLPQAPAAFVRLLERALEKDPEERHANVADFARELGELGSEDSRLSTERVSRIIYGNEGCSAPVRPSEAPADSKPSVDLSSEETLVAPGSLSRSTPPASTKDLDFPTEPRPKRFGIWAAAALAVCAVVLAASYYSSQASKTEASVLADEVTTVASVPVEASGAQAPPDDEASRDDSRVEGEMAVEAPEPAGTLKAVASPRAVVSPKPVVSSKTGASSRTAQGEEPPAEPDGPAQNSPAASGTAPKASTPSAAELLKQATETRK